MVRRLPNSNSESRKVGIQKPFHEIAFISRAALQRNSDYIYRYGPYCISPFERSLIDDIKTVLSPDLLDKGTLERWTISSKRLAGYSRAASQAQFHALGGSEFGYSIKHGWVGDVSHWFVRRDHQNLDVTFTQFDDSSFAYNSLLDSTVDEQSQTEPPCASAIEILIRVGRIRRILNPSRHPDER